MTGPGAECSAPRPLSGLLRKVAIFCETIKISHSVFALPFAVSASFLAARGLPQLDVLSKVILAVILARTAAMAFNRWADADLDAINPRTRSRAVPAGLLTRRFVGLAALAGSASFVVVSAWINPLALALSPVALAVLLGYSFTKRFTSFSHLVLGAALGLSPLGAWVAVRGEMSWLPTLLGLAVLTWTAGFDVIYACQDHEFDSAHGLHSIPRKLGIARALVASIGLHVMTLALLSAVGLLGGLGALYWAGVGCVGAILTYEHSLVRPTDLTRVNLAFFTLNGLVSLVFMSAVIAETLL